MSIPSWHKTAMETAKTWANRSKDTSTKVGCCILGPNHEVRSVGYNGFPRNVDDTIIKRYERPLKYKFTEHSERNAIYNAVRMGIGLEGCTLYTTMSPCCDCARGIIQTGIIQVIVNQEIVPERWVEDFELAINMLREAGVEVLNMDLKPAKLTSVEDYMIS